MTKLMLIGLALGAVLAIGCGDNGTHEQQSDAGTAPDAEQPPAEDAGTGQDAPAGCGFAAVYSTMDFVSTAVGTNSSYDPNQYVYLDGFLDQGATPDLLEIELMAGYGVFADGIKTGTFNLTGDEINYGSCGLCVRLLSKVDPATWEAGQYYMATGGTVTITSLHPQVAGTLANVKFEHVSIDTVTLESTPLGDGCTTQAKSASFDAELEAPDGGWEDIPDGGASMPDGMHM
jgi:hypothetical protein